MPTIIAIEVRISGLYNEACIHFTTLGGRVATVQRSPLTLIRELEYS
jgi:hypothetical protein